VLINVMGLVRLVTTTILAALAAGVASAQLPVARLLTVSPPGGQVGTTFEISVSGSDLEETTGLRFYDTNIFAKPKIVSETGLPEANKFLVTISSNAFPGLTEVRTTGRFGISSPRAFAIGAFPEVTEKPDNHTAAAAAEVAIGSTVNAQADASAFDYFRFAAKKGQRILVECRAKSIDSRLDPSMMLYDSAGREVDRARNQELIDFIAPADGTNILKVSDFLYRGGSEYFYRLTIHSGPHIDFVLPPSALPGTTNQHVIYGRNLPGGTVAGGMTIGGKPLEQLPVEIAAPAASQPHLLDPAALAIRGFYYHLKTGTAISEPAFVSFATGPVVGENKDNDRPESAQKVLPPCEFVGQLYPAGDRDWITFDAKKGDVYWLEIFSQRLGVPTDPFFVVQRVTRNDKGEVTASDVQEAYATDTNVGGQEFKTSSLDPAWRFEVKEDGTYRVQVRDLFNRMTGDARHIYRLAIRKEQPAFELAVLPQLPASKGERAVMPWAPLLRRGETVTLRVLAVRRDGFGTDIALSAQGLPPEISCAPAKIEGGKNAGLLLLTASDTASNWSGTIKVIGKGKVGETELVREALGGFVVWPIPDYNNETVDSRITPEIALGVIADPTPISIIAATNSLEATAGTKLKIPLTIARNGEFTEKLKLKIAGAQPLDSMKEIEVEGKSTNATFEIDLDKAKLPPGTHTVYFTTQTKGKYSNNTEGAKQAEVAAKEAETAAGQAVAEAKKTSEAVAVAAKAALEAEAAVKSANDKLTAAKSAAEQSGADEKAAAAKAEAEKLAADVAIKAKAANEAKVAAEKASAEAAAKAKTTEARKTALAALAKELTEKAKPKEVTVAVYSRPFEIRVNPAPATAKK
jgi:hypothetical protein